MELFYFQGHFLSNIFYKELDEYIQSDSFQAKQDSKELSPRPLENAPKTFNSKKLFKLLMLKGSLSFWC